MTRPDGRRSQRRAFTLIEVLLATALTLMLMGAVVQIFGLVGQSVSDSRSTLEMTDRLRSTSIRLQRDLAGVTVTMDPPRRPENDEGYFEYTEGRIGYMGTPGSSLSSWPEYANRNLDLRDSSGAAERDSTVDDNDDMLMFTARSTGEPFVGRYNSVPGAASSTTYITSMVAEVAWFVRGRTLYRRQLLVAPRLTAGWGSAPNAGFYRDNDVSVRIQNGIIVANGLGDLTKPENRFAHQIAQPGSPATTAYNPYHPWRTGSWRILGLPRLVECASTKTAWNAAAPLPTVTLTALTNVDLWRSPYPYALLDPAAGSLVAYYNPSVDPTDVTRTSRYTEDVILTNVLSFDVKGWDPGAMIYDYSNSGPTLMPGDPLYGVNMPNSTSNPSDTRIRGYGAYVDLGWADEDYSVVPGVIGSTTPVAVGVPERCLSHVGNQKSGLQGKNGSSPNPGSFRVYDTWSTHYEFDGALQRAGSLGADAGANGFDDNGDGVVDDPLEADTMPPYPTPLRGIQVKIRTFDPDSRQVREVKVIQDFVK